MVWSRKTRIARLAATLLGLALVFGSQAPGRASDGSVVNGEIAFHTDRDGDYEIYSMNPDGSGQTNLTNNGANDFYPAWSADGTKIAFTATRDGNYEIYVMNADGSGQTNLTNSAENEFTSAWSPDGTKIAFARNRVSGDGSPLNGVVDIYVMNADGSDQTRLTDTGLFDLYPDWSPDGSKIAFARAVFGGVSWIYVMNADGSDQAQLSPSDGLLAQGPDWSPDGTQIAYGGGFGFGATADVYVINADGSGVTNLTPGTSGSSDQAPAWSPDGTKIAFLSAENITDGAAEIYVMNADGSGQTNLTNNSVSDEPDWRGTSLSLTPKFGHVTDHSTVKRDAIDVSGQFAYEPSSDGEIDPSTEFVTIVVGPAGEEQTLVLDPDDMPDGIAWKVKGTTYTWASKKGAIPKWSVKIETKPTKESFRFQVTDLTFAATIANPVTVRMEVGEDVGEDVATWPTATHNASVLDKLRWP